MIKTLYIKKCPILPQNHPVSFLFQFFVLVAVLGLPQKGSSQVVIGGWDTSTLPGGTNNFGPSPYAATETAANVTVGGLTRGLGISTTGTATARGWGGTSWGTSSNNGDSSVLFNDFFTFTVKANAGYNLSLSSIGPFDYQRSTTGPIFAEIQYQAPRPAGLRLVPPTCPVFLLCKICRRAAR
jgi:hypothetical protein